MAFRCVAALHRQIATSTLIGRLLELSVTGRLQLITLIFDLFFQLAVVGSLYNTANIAIGATVANALACLVSIAVTIFSENPFTFAVLVWFMSVQGALTTAIVVCADESLGASPPLWARIVTIFVTWSLCCLFAALQVGVRKSWGWHHFKKSVVRESDLKLYAIRQRVFGCVVLDFGQSILMLFGSATTSFSGAQRKVLTTVGVVSALLALMATPQVVVAVRRENAAWLALLIIMLFASIGLAAYVATIASMEFNNMTPDFENSSIFELHYDSLSRATIAAICWLSVVSHIGIMITAALCRYTFGRGLNSRTFEDGAIDPRPFVRPPTVCSGRDDCASDGEDRAVDQATAEHTNRNNYLSENHNGSSSDRRFTTTEGTTVDRSSPPKSMRNGSFLPDGFTIVRATQVLRGTMVTSVASKASLDGAE